VVSANNPVTQYYAAKIGNTSIYMATDITGEVGPRKVTIFSKVEEDESWKPEGLQPGAFNFNGQTRCKCFSSERSIDDQVGLHCSLNYLNLNGVLNLGLGYRFRCLWYCTRVYIIISFVIPGTAYETPSGGPFMQDISN